MRLDIVYTKDHHVTVQNVKYITAFRGRLYYFEGEAPVQVVDLKDVAAFSMIE